MVNSSTCGVQGTPAVAFLAGESLPFFKTGGLADVIWSLSNALVEAGADVRVFLPWHRRQCLVDAARLVLEWSGRVSHGGRVLPVRLFSCRLGRGVVFYLLDQPELFGRSHLYGPAGGDFSDNPFRFSFFCRAVLELLPAIGFRPRIIHGHDWHAALASVYLRELFHRKPFYRGMKTVFTVHNLGYQGVFPKEAFALLSLPDGLFTPEGLEFYGRLNMLKGGLLFSDRLTTVSPSYSREIQTAEYGLGLEGVLRMRSDRLTGILNGIDRRYWDPGTDPLIRFDYAPGDSAGKAANKKILCRDQRLDANGPLLGMVTRLVPEKGLSLLQQTMPGIIALGFRLHLLGGGLAEYENFFRAAAARLRGRFAFSPGYQEKTAHRIYAGADFLLMPSLYEPCGLSQMIALRYGTVPVVRRTGGLGDSVTAFDGLHGNGFLFTEPVPATLEKCLAQAIDAYRDPVRWSRLVGNAFAADFSWTGPAGQYLELYRTLAKEAGDGPAGGE